jgi:hypothetical protein
VVEQQYERERRMSHGFATAQQQPYQFANTSRSPRGGGTGGGGAAADMSLRIPKRPRWGGCTS